MGLKEIVSFTVPANVASIRVMEKIGIADSRRIRGLGIHQIRELTAHFNLS